MKKVNNCNTDNCIETQSSCTIWNGGDIDYLGICNGQSINNVIWEIVTKLEDIAGDDLSSFDIDSLLDICNQKAPTQVTLISVLNIIKQNQICLFDFIKILEERINEINRSGVVSANLKCYADFDNLGNSLQLNRDQFDQLLINIVCEHKTRIETLEGKVIDLQSQIDTLNNTSQVEELSFATCVDAGVKPTSTQVKNIADAFCDFRDLYGSVAEMQTALGQVPTDFDTDYSSVNPGAWIPANVRNSFADVMNNLLIAFGNLTARVKSIEETCCQVSCKDIELGFSTRYNEDRDGIIITFTSGSGTYIPLGFTDAGSMLTISDAQNGQITYNLDIPDMFYNGTEVEIPILTLSNLDDLVISIDAKITNGSITCDKCLSQTVKRPGCAYCTITATEDVTIVYKICIAS